MIIKRIGPVSCAKITGTLYAIIGLLIGLVVALISMVGGFASRNAAAGGITAVLGIGSIVVFPLCYGALGFVMTLFAAWLYNVLSGIVGGVQIDLE